MKQKQIVSNPVITVEQWVPDIDMRIDFCRQTGSKKTDKLELVNVGGYTDVYNQQTGRYVEHCPETFTTTVKRLKQASVL